MPAGLRLILKPGEIERVFTGFRDPLAEAGTLAIRDAADFAKARGRAAIAAGGFSRKWQNALRVDVFPRRGVSLNAAAWIFHKIGYAGVFQEGAGIVGRPLLWIPLTTTPKLPGRKKATPEEFAKRFGDLFSINRPGHPPLLAANVAGRGGRRARRVRRVSAAALSRGGGGMVPLFVGVPRVKMPKRFNLTAVFQQAGGNLARYFAAHIKRGPKNAAR